MNVSLGNELIKKSVPLLVTDLALDRDKHVLEVHDRVIELHGTFWHIGLLPGRLHQFLLPFDLGLTDVFIGLLHVFDNVGLRFL